MIREKKTTKAVTQSGSPKVCGSKSYIDKVTPTAKVQKQILTLGGKKG